MSVFVEYIIHHTASSVNVSY